MNDPFETLDAKDGYHVTRVDAGPHVSLHAQVHAGGELVDPGDFLLNVQTDQGTVEIREWREATPADDGEATRLHLVLEAVCRYFNTGGRWEELGHALKRLGLIAPGGLDFPGYHYSDAYPLGDGRYEHLFVKDDNSRTAVLWEEPEYAEAGDSLVGGTIRITDLDTLLQEQEEDDPGEPEGDEEGDDAEADPAPPQLGLQPQDRPDPEAQGGVEGNSHV
jgi:hypothetical protein